MYHRPPRIEHKLSYFTILCYLKLEGEIAFSIPRGNKRIRHTDGEYKLLGKKKLHILGNIVYLGIPRISVSHKPLIVGRYDILRHVKRLVKEFEIRHVVTNVDLACLYVFIMYMVR